MATMTRLHLLLRNLRYFRAANFAVAAGMAVATAVLTGALMVGDSVRGSLRDLALERLGRVDHALVATRFVNADLADRLKAATGLDVAPTVIVKGGAAAEGKDARTAGVQIAGLGGGWMDVPRSRVVANGELADALTEKPGGTALLRLPMIEDAPRDAALARRGRDDVLAGMRVELSKVERERGFTTLFNLEGSQRVPRNAWVNLRELQAAIGQPGRVNALLASGEEQGGDVKLNAALKTVLTLDDYGLSLTKSPDGKEAVLNSRATFIDRPVLDAAAGIAGSIPARRVSVYLLNTVTLADAPAGKPDPKRTIFYAVGAGVDDVEGQKLAADEVTLNEWAAKQINAKVGDRLRFTYYLRQPGGQLRELASDREGVGMTFRVARILPMSGVGADASLTPQYKGLTDAEHFSDWNPPEGMKIDEKLADEAYWDKYKAAPKVLLNFETAKKLWGGVYGDVTSLRVPADKAEEFARRLLDTLQPKDMGLAFQPIKQQQLAASSGSTDFSMLFVGFSFFLIVAAALLVAMLFRLNIEQRARQIGLIGALGFAPKSMRRMALAEGMLVAVAGGVVGLAGAVGYTWVMMYGLRTWWVGAVGTTAMRLHVIPMTLVIGLVASLLVAMVAIAWASWDVGRADAARLLAGGWHSQESMKRRRGWVAKGLAVLGGFAGIGMIAAGASGKMSAKEAFLGGGSSLLVACLAGATIVLRPKRTGGGFLAWAPRPSDEVEKLGRGAQATSLPTASLSLNRLGIRNATRNTGRSVLAVGLIAFAAFTLVTVACMKEGPPDDTHERKSGAGGYRLIVQADIPLLADPSTAAGRISIGLDEPGAAIWNNVQFTPMRSWAGQDISCLNLTKPSQPTILAVPPSMVERNAFAFAAAAEKVDNPWTLLDKPMADEKDVPVITDAETSEYILHLGLGDAIPITDQLGRPRNLRLVGTLAHSIFQGQMLMGEANFLKCFPSQAGFGTLLVETSAADEKEVQRRLATGLEENAAIVDRTADRLAAYAEVKNTYLSTFQTLGSLGLMLGTMGLAVVLLRSLVERRGELALLTALGFRPGGRTRLVLGENAFLLLLGLLVGTGCAALGVSPTLLSSDRTVNLTALTLTLLAVLIIGLAGLALAVWLGQRRIKPADLRAE